MTLRIRKTFEFADYESGRGGIQKQVHILVVLLTYYWYIFEFTIIY